MAQESGHFQSNPYPEIEIPSEKKEAVILPFKKRAEPGVEEEVQGYDRYVSLGGMLDQKQYTNIMELDGEGRVDFSNSMSRDQVNSIAKIADIILSPEVLDIYMKLRNEKEEKYSSLSDHKLLAEALRITGDKDSLSTFIKKYPHIFN